MDEQRPSKEQDYLAKLQDSHPMVQLQREVDRLQRQQTNLIAALGEAQAKIDELSIHAEKWVKRALGSDQSWYGGQVNEEACKTLVRLNREARELAASAYQDGYGEALTDDRDLSERTHELMRRLSRPAHEREGPHCSTCACGLAPEPVTRRFKVGDEVPIAHWGATSKIVSIHCTLANGETIAVDCIAPEPAQAQPIPKAYIDRIHDAEQTVVGDVWTKRRKPEHFVEILGRAGHSRQTLILRHWNGRVTNKWYSYLASDYELTKRATQPPRDGQ